MIKKPISMNIYLNFEGNCREAMEFYQSCLGGELNFRFFRDAPLEVSIDHQSKVMHSTLKFEKGILMASDTLPNQKVNKCNGTSIMISQPDHEEAKILFEKLSAGGKITMPMEKTFWGSFFGMCIDQFGYSWMVDCELDGQQ